MTCFPFSRVEKKARVYMLEDYPKGVVVVVVTVVTTNDLEVV